MWNSIVSVPDHCIFICFSIEIIFIFLLSLKEKDYGFPGRVCQLLMTFSKLNENSFLPQCVSDALRNTDNFGFIILCQRIHLLGSND